MKAAIYNPYLDTLGGGERYSMAIATTLNKFGYKVDVEWKNESIKEKLEERFGIDLNDINIVTDVKRGDGYDVCFWVSDGSIPALKSRNNFLHFQVPFQNVGGRSLMNKFKLMRIKKIICNSKFTKKIIDTEFGIESVVIYPPVSITEFKPKKKEDIILNVGRFSNLLQSKGQDVLIKAFKKFSKTHLTYKLILAGGVEVGATGVIEKLKQISKGLPIEIIKSPSFKEIKELYGKASIFWSASGYGINEKKDPQRVEHFGITIVESMASGCVPIVVKSGGHKEIIKDGINGFLWETTSGLLNKTKKITDDIKQMKIIVQKAKASAKQYSYEKFEKEFMSLL